MTTPSVVLNSGGKKTTRKEKEENKLGLSCAKLSSSWVS
jgi:hypothetical protein